MVKYIFFDLDETLIDIKYAQNEAIKSLYFNYGFDDKSSLDKFVKTWDELTDYHYSFYTAKQISYDEQRKRRIEGLFSEFGVKLRQEALEIYAIYLTEFENSWKVFDGVIETLENLKNDGIFIRIN